jgi:hypothetical protein
MIKILPLPVYNQKLGWLSQNSDGLQDGWLEFDSLQGQEIFLHTIATRPASYPMGTRSSFSRV